MDAANCVLLGIAAVLILGACLVVNFAARGRDE